MTMGIPPGDTLAGPPGQRPRWPVVDPLYPDSEQAWDAIVPGTPAQVPASTTSTFTLEVGDGARAILLAVSVRTNLTSMTLVGLSTGATYSSIGASPTSSLFLVAVYPSVDDRLTLTVVTNGSGPVSVYCDELTGSIAGSAAVGSGNAFGPFPAAQPLSDALANPTTTEVGANLLVFDGTTWQRVRDAIQVDSSLHAMPGLSMMLYSFNANTYKLLTNLASTADASTGERALAVGGAAFNGTTWDRLRSLSAVGDGLGVNLAAQPSATPFGQTAAAAAANTVTITGVAGQRIRLVYLNASYSGSMTAARIITVSDGTTTLSFPIPTVADVVEIPPVPGGIKFAVGATVTITMPADATAPSQCNGAYLIA